MKLEVGYVGSQGTGCWQRMTSITQTRRPASTSLTSRQPMPLTSRRAWRGPTTCGQFAEDAPFYIPEGRAAVALHLPYAQNNSVIPAARPLAKRITLVGLRPYSSPQCDPLTGIGCPINSTPVFTGIFAQDTIASSAYNSLQISLDKRLPAAPIYRAYTFSKSIDEASSFEGY